MNENVLVFDKDQLIKKYNINMHGLTRHKNIDDLCSVAVFKNRQEMESNIKFKQIIPYIVIRNEYDLFTVKRLKKQSESRLHNKISFGIGGHINPIDSGYNVIETALKRELEEELILINNDILSLELIGFVNDEGNEVGKVHVGIFYELLTSSRDIKVKEYNKMKGGFVPISDLMKIKDHMESWTKLIFEQYYEEIV